VSHVAVSDLRTAAYCPRKLYYVRQEDDRSVPPEVDAIRDLARRYRALLDADDATLREEPIATDPATYRQRLRDIAQRRDDWDGLVDPEATDALLTGRDVRGVARKVLAGPPRPVLVSPGEPPENGVWAPQSVAAVALAKALAYERQESVERAVVEYPAHAVVRTVRLTTRKKAAYRRVLRTVRAMDGPPPRVDDRGKCETCEYRAECGVPTRTLASIIKL
jgi:CRISPR-associated exonuclease Cas4